MTAPEVKPLEWSAEFKPGENGCSYNHCFADTPFGRYQIEWKGWKDYPCFDCRGPGDFLDSGDNYNTLEGMKAEAQAHFAGSVLSCICAIKPEKEP